MAWQARVQAAKADIQNGGGYTVEAVYYDDADDTFSYTEHFQFAQGTTRAQARAAIVARGQALRTVHTANAALKNDINAVIAIP